MPDINKMKYNLVYSAKDDLEANLVKGFLEHKSISAVIGGPNRLPKGVYVAQTKAKKARELLRAHKVARPHKKVLRKANHAFVMVLVALMCIFVVDVVMH